MTQNSQLAADVERAFDEIKGLLALPADWSYDLNIAYGFSEAMPEGAAMIEMDHARLHAHLTVFSPCITTGDMLWIVLMHEGLHLLSREVDHASCLLEEADDRDPVPLLLRDAAETLTIRLQYLFLAVHDCPAWLAGRVYLPGDSP